MDVVVRASEPIKVTGEGFEERILVAGQSETFTVLPGGGLSVDPAPLDQIQPPPVTDDVFSPANRPNGAMTAAIAPKLPKSSGELRQVEENGRMVERAVADVGVATQGGGPETQDGTTPGPQPAPMTESVGVLGTATGDVNARGQPVERTTEAVSQGPAPAPAPSGPARAPAESPKARSAAKESTKRRR